MGDNWNKCSQSLRVKKVKIIYILAAGKKCTLQSFFFPEKTKTLRSHGKIFFFLEMRRKLLIFNNRIPVFPKNTDHDHMYFLVKYKIPRLHSGMSNMVIFLSQSGVQFTAFCLEFGIPSCSAALLKPFALKERFVIIWTSDLLMINYLNF